MDDGAFAGLVAAIVESIRDSFDDRPYKVFFANGDWTCSISRFSGTMTGTLVLPDGTEIPPTGKSFEVDFCTVARWENEQIVEENLCYDVVGMMGQLGIG